MKRKNQLKKIPIQHYSDRNYASFMSFINCVKQSLKFHEHDDSEIIQTIQDKLPGTYFQMAENLIHELQQRGEPLTSDLFIQEMNTLISGGTNATVNYNLRLLQSDIDRFDFAEFATRKFFAYTKKRPNYSVKDKMSEIALAALPQISDKLVELVDSDPLPR